MVILDDKDSDVLSTLFGSPAIAYVRPVKTDIGMNYAVCSPDGIQLAIFASQDEARFAAKQHDLEPVLLH